MNIIEEEDKNSISDVEECSAIFKNKEKRATEATNKDIFENIKTEEIYTESEWSEEELKLNLFIFDVFEEVPIRGDWNCMFRALALGGFGCENSYPLIREMIWDFIHTNSERFIPFIIDGYLDNYLKNKRKNYWGEKNYYKVKIASKQSRDHILKENFCGIYQKWLWSSFILIVFNTK